MEVSPSIQSVVTKSDFESVFREHYASLCRYAFSLLTDSDEAEEVVQEALFRVWEGRHRISITTSWQAYLFRAVRNQALNHLRKRKVHQEYLADGFHQPGESLADASEAVSLAELQMKIRDAVAKLPPERQRIFIMSRYEGLKYREIADELGISPKTVENQLGRALQSLRTELADYLPLVLILFADFFES